MVEAVGLMKVAEGHVVAYRVRCPETCIVERTPPDLLSISKAEFKKFAVRIWEAI